MKSKWRGPWALAGLCACAWSGMAAAQDSPAASPVAPAAAACELAAGTPVEIEFVDTVNSRTNHNGDRFAIRVRVPLRLGDAVVAPAGAIGVGEVVHAARARGGGKGGELIVAARYVEANGVRFPLRGLRIGGSTGQDRNDEALATAVAFGVAAFLIAGNDVNYPAGLPATARLSAAVPVAGACAPAPAAASAITGGE